MKGLISLHVVILAPLHWLKGELRGRCFLFPNTGSLYWLEVQKRVPKTFLALAQCPLPATSTLFAAGDTQEINQGVQKTPCVAQGWVYFFVAWAVSYYL